MKSKRIARPAKRAHLWVLNERLGERALSEDRVRTIAAAMTQAGVLLYQKLQAKSGIDIKTPGPLSSKGVEMVLQRNGRALEVMHAAASYPSAQRFA